MTALPADLAYTADLPTALAGVDPTLPVTLYPLTFLDEGDEVTVGRLDVDSYCVLPADGAALLRLIADEGVVGV